jgi:hypothetical protein
VKFGEAGVIASLSMEVGVIGEVAAFSFETNAHPIEISPTN